MKTVLTLAAIAALGIPAHADVTVAAPTTSSNEFPFGGGTTEYQQVYAASAFTGPVTIIGLTFFHNHPGLFEAGHLAEADYTIQLSTTKKAVNGLDAVFANNLGADNITVFSGILSGKADPVTHEYTISDTQTFTYDPSQGNLLLTVLSPNPGPVNAIYFDAVNDGSADGLFSRVFSLDPSVFPDDKKTYVSLGRGLNTRFQTAPTPEPSTLVPFALGGAFLLLARRSRIKN